jgi:ssDNA-binding Zn-finger/Zn-ribbon topoisomerase 1
MNKCEVCGSEMLIDRMDKDGRIFYVCMKKTCSQYRRSFNPVTDERTESEISESKPNMIDKAEDPQEEPTHTGASQ